jgi:hypothetical protein
MAAGATSPPASPSCSSGTCGDRSWKLACHPSRSGRLTATLEGLGPLAESVVALTLRHALQDQAAAFIAEQAATAIRPQESPRMTARLSRWARCG